MREVLAVRRQMRCADELCAASGDRVWPFPMDDDFDSDLSSKIADILQCTPDSKGDHILAARFLKRFVPDEIPWVHLDLSASNRPGGLAHIPSDFTGFGLRGSRTSVTMMPRLTRVPMYVCPRATMTWMPSPRPP